MLKATKLSHTSINNKSKYLIVIFIISIALLLRLYVITVRKIDSFIIIYSLPLNVNNFFYKTIIFFQKAHKFVVHIIRTQLFCIDKAYGEAECHIPYKTRKPRRRIAMQRGLLVRRKSRKTLFQSVLASS